jgi:cysteine-rich repeat protein
MESTMKTSKQKLIFGLNHLTLASVLALGSMLQGCADDAGTGDTSADDGDGDETGDDDSMTETGDGDSSTGDGDGDGSTGDGDGDGSTGDGDGDGSAGDGDGDGSTGDGDGDADQCGDGVLQSPEVCDDANAVDLDGCTDTCEVHPDLIAYWPFDQEDEAAGIFDLTTNFDMDYEAGSTPGLSGGMAPTQGRNGAWYTYPGSTRHGVIDGNPANSLQGTISAWVKPPSAGNNNFSHVFWQGEAGGNGWGGEQETHLSMRDDNHFSFRHKNCQVESTDKVFEGTGWFHVSGTWSVSGGEITCAIYIYDGTVNVETHSSVSTAPVLQPETGTSYFGRSDSDADPRYMRGFVDELMIFDRDLSALELATLRAGQDDTGAFQ